MGDERNESRTGGAGHRRGIRLTVGVLVGIAILIYLGFIGRGVFG